MKSLEKFMSSFDKSYAIFGRGIAGLTGAYYLVKAGILPTIYGRQDGASQASRAAQGVLCNKGLIFSNSPLFRAKLESLKTMKSFLDELEKVSGILIPRYFEGVSEPFWSEEDFLSSVTRIYRHKFWGLHGTELHNPEKTSLESIRSPMGLLHYPLDGWFDPRAVLDALESYLKSVGVSFVDEEITSLGELGSQIKIGEKVFDRLILANGAGFFSLWAQLGVGDLRMFLIGGQTLECPRAQGSETSIQVKGSQSLALLDGKAIVGSSSWLGEVSVDIDADAEALRAECEVNFGVRLEGGLSRSGTRLRFKDRMPLVGWLNHGPYAKKVYLLSGFYKNGMHLAEICAREMYLDIIDESYKRKYPEFSGLRFSV